MPTNTIRAFVSLSHFGKENCLSKNLAKKKHEKVKKKSSEKSCLLPFIFILWILEYKMVKKHIHTQATRIHTQTL